MALKDEIQFGMSLPHRFLDPLDVEAVREVAQRAEALGFRELWVTNNTLDNRANCFDSLIALAYAAALTHKIRLGVSMLMLPTYHPVHVAHQVATLDYLSRGRAILGVAIGKESHYDEFQIPRQRRVRRLLEQVELIKALWTQDKVDYRGDFFQLKDAVMQPRPVQKPHPPIWMGGGHPDALKRAAKFANGWMASGGGGSNTESFAEAAHLLRRTLQEAGRDPAAFPISKRVFLSVHERPAVAKAEVQRWYTRLYNIPDMTTQGGVFGTPVQVRVQLEELVAAGATHLLLNPVARYAEHVDVLAEIVGLR